MAEIKKQIFLSYQWDKKKQIKALYKELIENGYTCWMDDKQMKGGDNLYESISEGIDGCKVFLSCVTRNYSISKMCNKEIGLAQSWGKPIIPLLLEKIKYPPKGPMATKLVDLCYINCYTPDVNIQNDWQCTQFKKLLKALKKLGVEPENEEDSEEGDPETECAEENDETDEEGGDAGAEYSGDEENPEFEGDEDDLIDDIGSGDDGN